MGVLVGREDGAPGVAVPELGVFGPGSVELELPEWFVAIPITVGALLVLAGVVVAGRAPRD